MVVIESKRRKRENILKKYPDAVIADVTSQATDEFVKLSLLLQRPISII